MEVKHDISKVKRKIKEQIRKSNEIEIKEHLIDTYNLMIDCEWQTVNLDLGNGFKVVCTILEGDNNDNGL